MPSHAAMMPIADSDSGSINPVGTQTPSSGVSGMKRKFSEAAENFGRMMLDAIDFRKDSVNSPAKDPLIRLSSDVEPAGCPNSEQPVTEKYEESPALCRQATTECSEPEKTVTTEKTETDTVEHYATEQEGGPLLEQEESAKLDHLATEKNEDLPIRRQSTTRRSSDGHPMDAIHRAIAEASAKGDFSDKKRRNMFSEGKRARAASDKKRAKDARKLRDEVLTKKRKGDEMFARSSRPGWSWFWWGKGKGGKRSGSQQGLVQDSEEMSGGVSPLTIRLSDVGNGVTVKTSEVFGVAGPALQRCHTIC